jgi:hypothetical protein
VSVGLDSGDEPTSIAVNVVEKPEILEAETEKNDGASYPPTSGWLTPFVYNLLVRSVVGRPV